MFLSIGLGLVSCKTPESEPDTDESTNNVETRRHVHKAVPSSRWAGDIELAATFSEQMPTGVTAADDGRIFVNFPRWEDGVKYTVGVVEDGELQAYPSMEMNRFDESAPAETWSSVQSVRIGPQDRLWVLDTGRPKFEPTKAGADKLVAIDIQSDEVVKTITFPDEVVRKTTYLNDVRFDMTRGEAGMAFITDSSGAGDNGIIVVDLETGESWRHLDRHPTTQADEDFIPLVEGRALMNRPADGAPSPMTVGSDGIALGPQGQRLYYRPLSGHGLFSVSVDLLADPETPSAKLQESVVSHGPLPFASDGLEMGADGRLFLTNYEDNAVMAWRDGELETVAYDPRFLWPDTLDVEDGAIYVTANQLHRQPSFHGGEDLRETPYVIYKIEMDVEPVVLK
jgi:sugar lactone lactonase YvrE